MSVCVLGSINLDIVLRVAEPPRPGETISAHGMSQYPGGKGANQAVAAARLGAPTTLIGAVGTDEAGTWMLDHLKEAGVDVGGVTRLADTPTGQAYIWVSDAGENAIVVVGGANQTLTAAAAGATPPARVYITQLETPAEAIAAVFASPQAAEAIKILNAAPALPAGKALLPLMDILIVNQTELATYAGAGPIDDWSQATIAAARALITRPGQSVVVTLGAEGVGVVTADEAFAVAGRPMPVVDTTGAGDCFCGALAARLGEGASLREAAVFANAAAGLSVGRAGAATSMPLRAEVEAILAG
ncbi:MAG: ribokinase [Caulobacteraceae bacterium]|nr:ribokinase [Caulobacteraceae bacterium]